MSAPPRWLQSGLRNDLELLVFEPLFEEANRCRRLTARVLRGLDAAGVNAAVAELPGTSESLTPIAEVDFNDWRDSAAAYHTRFVASFRGGALLDDAPGCSNVWRFAPETGSRIVRDLRRTALTSENGTLLAGHALSDDFLTSLEVAEPAAIASRTLRLTSDTASADTQVEGAPLWRRAEPGDDPELAVALADDLLTWMRSCAAS